MSEDEAEDSGDEEDDEEDDMDLFQEGKSPMTPELYKSVCKLFLEWGTSEGISFVLAFLFSHRILLANPITLHELDTATCRGTILMQCM
jgi:hypothetical protein